MLRSSVISVFVAQWWIWLIYHRISGPVVRFAWVHVGDPLRPFGTNFGVKKTKIVFKIRAEMDRTFAVFSGDGQQFAFCGSDGKLSIFDVNSGVLKQEYVPNLHLRSPCTSLSWISLHSNGVRPAEFINPYISCIQLWYLCGAPSQAYRVALNGVRKVVRYW